MLSEYKTDVAITPIADNEKKNWQTRLLNPLVLLTSIYWTINFLTKYLWFKLMLKYKGTHKGNKRRPRFAKKASLSFITPHTGPLILPKRSLGNIKLSFVSNTTSHKPQSVNDNEFIYAQARWSFLLEQLLNNDRNAWQQNLTNVCQWIKKNENKKLAIWEPYSASERISHLLNWLSFAPNGLISPKNEQLLCSFIIESAQWVYQHLEYYGNNTNNHLLNNARALILAGSSLNWSEATSSGVAIVEKMLPQLFQKDGMARERSSHYQIIFLNWLLDIYFFLQPHCSQHANFLTWFTPYLKRITQASKSLLNQNFQLTCLIGDISPDLSPDASCARLLLYHQSYLKNITSCKATKLDDWFFLRQYQHQVILNYPQQSYPKFPTHGHNDFTSFIWNYNGHAILIDSGRYRYTKDSLSTYHKSASAHNTILIDGLTPNCESFIKSSYWAPRCYAQSKLQVPTYNNRQIELINAGTKRIKNIDIYMRTISLKEKQLKITDKINGLGMHQITLLWHFPKSFDHFDPSSNQIYNKTIGLSVKHNITSFTQGALKTNDIKFKPSKCAYQYGELEESHVLIIKLSVKLPAEINTHFSVEEICVP